MHWMIDNHQPNNESMNRKLKNVQWSADLSVTGAIKRTSRTKLYKELGLESLKSRRTIRCFCSFHKIGPTSLPTYIYIYLFNLIPESSHGYQTRTSGNIPIYQCRIDTWRHSFFPLLHGTKYIQRLKMYLLEFLRTTH